ncbi:DUF5615 family PIN-like protein [Subtercola boreus]|uniref:DUF5615 domain-containing protein n=1 Tax=Subtercola boreus TaxID=120213 RepID=A0A3E0W6M5_9MICO|nr:DUF5615 family PIN-like protein [Subtercola boreus]RFA18174.1 hypothetical protein B7R24_16145 [Subtercola boreus]RFA18556.1 hypothetical protein B7R23_16180 [Subtercola boreus]RFA25084.1 hypothetical protein B7R25_16175 [Subtercola boreus]
MRFLVDAQLPPALARMLSAHGHLAAHVTDIGLADSPDRDLWLYALDHEAVLITKDEDFSSMLVFGGEAPVVVWIRVGNTSRRALIEWFEPLVERVVEMIEAGDDLVELR